MVKQFYLSKTFLWGILGIGIILLMRQYLFNRSFWPDEAALALNILDKSYSELLQPLDFNVAAPLGFLLLEKLLVQALGDSEYVLRLIPVLSAALALGLLVKVLPYFLTPAAVPVAFGFCAASNWYIYYATTLKQYASDVLIAVLLYAVVITVLAKPPTFRRMLLFGGSGALCLWFSHPAVFILAGVGATITGAQIARKAWTELRRYALAYGCWILSLAAIYWISLREIAQNTLNQQFWANADRGFLPFPPDLIWMGKAFFETIQDLFGIANADALTEQIAWLQAIGASVLGVSPSLGVSLVEMFRLFCAGLGWVIFYLISAVMLIAGGIVIGLKNKTKGLLLISPIILVIIASGLHKYPLAYKLLLFSTPILFMFLGEGAIWLSTKRKPLIGVVLIAAVCGYPWLQAGRVLISPQVHEEARPVLHYLKTHKQAGDGIYVYYMSGHVYRYYARRFGFAADTYIQGIAARTNWQNYLQDLQQLRGQKRVWLFFSHAYAEETFFLQYLDTIGKRLDEFEDVRAAVYLYDLRTF